MNKILLSLLLTIPFFGFAQKTANEFRQAGIDAMKNGNTSEALANYLLAKELNPYDWQIHNNLGYFYYSTQEFNLSVESYNEAIRLIEFDTPPSRFSSYEDQVYINCGKAHLELKNYEDAIENFSKWIKFSAPINEMNNMLDQYKAACVYKDRGRAYLYLGQKELACKDWKSTSACDNTKWFDEYCK